MNTTLKIAVFSVFLIACQSNNPLDEEFHVSCSYKYSLIQNWTGEWNGSEFVDTTKSKLDNCTFIFVDDYENYYLLGYEDNNLIFAKDYTHFKNISDYCELFTGECVGTTEFYQNNVLDGKLVFWIPPDTMGIVLYSEFPLTANMLNLPEGFRVWNAFDINIIR